MPDYPNLDYDPGPSAASYSRVGPPPRRVAKPQAPPEPAPAVQVFRHEMAAELGAARPAGARRHNHRKYKHAH